LVALGMVFPAICMKIVDRGEDPFIAPLAMPLVTGSAAIAIALILGSSQTTNTFTWVLALSTSGCLAALILILLPWFIKVFSINGVRALEWLLS